MAFPSWYLFALLAKNSQEIPTLSANPFPNCLPLNRIFLPFSRQRRHFSCLSLILPTNEVKGVLLCTLGSAPKFVKVCKKSPFLAKSLTSSTTV